MIMNCELEGMKMEVVVGFLLFLHWYKHHGANKNDCHGRRTIQVSTTRRVVTQIEQHLMLMSSSASRHTKIS